MKREWLLITLLGASRACIIHFICSNFRLKACRNRVRKRAAFLLFSLAAVSVPLCMREHVSRQKCVLTGLWELIPRFEMFHVISRNTTVYFKYFKQCNTQALFQVPVSPFWSGWVPNSKYCWALELLGARWVCSGSFFLHKLMAWLCLYQLLCSSYFFHCHQKEWVFKLQKHSSCQQVIQESNRKYVVSKI